MTDFRTHYGIFWTDDHGRHVWARSSNKREAVRFAKRVHGAVGQVNHGRGMAWDAPTFKVMMTPIANYQTRRVA